MHLRTDHMGRVELIGQTGDGTLSDGPSPPPRSRSPRGLAPDAPLPKTGLSPETVAKMQLRTNPPYVAAKTLRNCGRTDAQIASFLAANMQSPTQEKIQAALRDSV